MSWAQPQPGLGLNQERENSEFVSSLTNRSNFYKKEKK